MMFIRRWVRFVFNVSPRFRMNLSLASLRFYVSYCPTGLRTTGLLENYC
jgi:hypothetical protein